MELIDLYDKFQKVLTEAMTEAYNLGYKDGSGGEIPQQQKRTRKEKVKSEDLILPFASMDFKNAWDEWVQFRKEKKSKLTDTTIKRQFAFLKGLGEEHSIASISRSIGHGYTGLFEVPNFTPHKPYMTVSPGKSKFSNDKYQ